MDPLDFFGALYETAAPGLGVVELRALKNAGGFHDRLFTGNPDDIRDWTSKYQTARPYGAYYGVALRKPGSETGKKTDISVITALWADIDVAKNGWDMAKTLGALKVHELRPSAVVDSGHGYHLYWALKEPLVIDGSTHYSQEPYRRQTIENAEVAMQNLAEVFGGDNTTDVTRVLRVPGTWNTKDPDKPKLVKVVLADWVEYPFNDLLFMSKVSMTALAADGWIDRAEMQRRAKEAAAAAGIVGAYTTATGLRARPMTWHQIWDHAKAGGGPVGSAFVGLDEAILRATALLFASSPMTDEDIVDAVTSQLRKKIPADKWNERAERAKVKDKLDRFKPKWVELQAERKNERQGKSRKPSNVK